MLSPSKYLLTRTFGTLSRTFTSSSSVLSMSRQERRQLRRKEDNPMDLAFTFNHDDEEDQAKRYKYNPKDYDVPDLRNLEKRWNSLDALDQEDIQLYLEDRMRVDWKDLSLDEKRAIWFVNYGPWGPRAVSPDKPERIYGYYVWFVVGVLGAVSAYKFGVEGSPKEEEN